MQENLEMHRHQLLSALAQSAESLRNAAAMVDAFANLVQLTPQVGVPVNPMNPMAMYQMFANLQQQAGAVGAPFGAGQAVGANGQMPGAPDGGMKVEEGGKRKRRRGPNIDKKDRKPRDPNKPKRPPSAYLLFQNEVRKEMQGKYPNMPYHELLGKIAARWGQMTDEDKKIYNDQTAVSKLRFQEEKAVYDANTAGNGNGFIPVVPPVQPVAAPVAAVVDDEEEASEESSPKVKDGASSSGASSDSSSDSDAGSDSEEEHPAPKKKARKPPSKTAPAATVQKQEKEKKKKKKKAEEA